MTLHRHKNTHKPKRSNRTPNRGNTPRRSRISSLHGEIPRRGRAVLTLTSNGLGIIPRRRNGIRRRRLGPGDDRPARGRGHRAGDVVQRRGPVCGEVAWLVEFVGRVCESDVFAVCVVEGGVAGVPGPVGDRVVEVWEVFWEEDGPEVCAREGGDCVGADLPGAGYG
jgi:hypothetical protein